MTPNGRGVTDLPQVFGLLCNSLNRRCQGVVGAGGAERSRLQQRHPQLVRGIEAAGADGTVTDTCPTWPTLVAWLENDLRDVHLETAQSK